jgi:catechol 2,3-dioxygenase-like lactoylglutathione lyase family enzyme
MDHLAIPVHDQERSRRWYETYFGFGARPPRRYEDGVLMLYDATGFALALGPTDDEIVARPWMHFGVGLDDRHAVRKLRHRIAADGVELVEEWDEPDMSASSAAIRTATSSKPSGNQSDEQWGRVVGAAGLTTGPAAKAHTPLRGPRAGDAHG